MDERSCISPVSSVALWEVVGDFGGIAAEPAYFLSCFLILCLSFGVGDGLHCVSFKFRHPNPKPKCDSLVCL